jgi:endonuclease/exonuclease/phosphatase family metal-dependent hydrolase
MKQALSVAFWNVYNLFREGAHAKRGPKSQSERHAKLDALAAVINKLAHGALPDILVLAEVGDAQLIGELITRLNLTFRNSPPQVFEPPRTTDQTGIVVLGLTPRIAMVERIDAENRGSRPRALSVKISLSNPTCPPLYLIACHWKSNRPEGNPRQDRRESGEWLRSHLNGSAPNGKADAVIVVGDFNADPYSPEISHNKALHATRHFQKSIRASGVRLFNCMWPWLVDPKAWSFLNAQVSNLPWTLTSHSDVEPRLFDQILVSRSILKEERFSLKTVDYFRDDSTTKQLPQEKALVPKPWAWDDSVGTGSGTSDHFPLIASLLY